MICVYQLVKNVVKCRNEREKEEVQKHTSNNEPMNFFLNSMSDETYLDMIREYIQFLIDEDYKYSEQLEMINLKSARNIKYNTYTNFVKRFILETPRNLFQNRESKLYQEQSNFVSQQEDSKSYNNFENQYQSQNTHTEQKILHSDKLEINTHNKKGKAKTNMKQEVKNTFESSSIEKTSPVAPLRRNNLNTKPRENISFQHEAMPNVDELY